jgi:hypothetical protein
VTPEEFAKWKMRRRGGKRPLTAEEIEARRVAGLEKYRAENPDWATKNRNWSDGVKNEYERQAKRKKCKGKTKQGTDCPAMATPSGSGYCSTHEQQGMQVGDTVKKIRICQLCLRNPADPTTETNYCKQCYEARVAAGKRIAAGKEIDIHAIDYDPDNPLGNVDEL